MDLFYKNLTEEQRNAAQAYAAERGLAFESGYDGEEDTYHVRLLPGDEGAPQWTGADIDAVEAIVNG